MPLELGGQSQNWVPISSVFLVSGCLGILSYSYQQAGQGWTTAFRSKERDDFHYQILFQANKANRCSYNPGVHVLLFKFNYCFAFCNTSDFLAISFGFFNRAGEKKNKLKRLYKRGNSFVLSRRRARIREATCGLGLLKIRLFPWHSFIIHLPVKYVLALSLFECLFLSIGGHIVISAFYYSVSWRPLPPPPSI